MSRRITRIHEVISYYLYAFKGIIKRRIRYWIWLSRKSNKEGQVDTHTK